ncbi:hypothetical protein Q4591_02665 [Shewanella sp. 3_MG-2023]|uniref:hypothetical protein n=1 Tax=Shewanella sp. 3_MG-2023 TaxID=3062635 RepID=UPI0026E280FA|nr:hypothetical protein [Shewanella sp. 3_MG-2023]MDO6774243.1 hypothetical protein [Shewanella sp. 3_MG-2023]
MLTFVIHKADVNRIGFFVSQLPVELTASQSGIVQAKDGLVENLALCKYFLASKSL